MHKRRSLLAHAPKRLHEEISADCKEMIYADTKLEIATKAWRFCSCAMVMSALGIGTTAEALVSVVVPVVTFGKCNGGFQYFS